MDSVPSIPLRSWSCIGRTSSDVAAGLDDKWRRQWRWRWCWQTSTNLCLSSSHERHLCTNFPLFHSIHPKPRSIAQRLWRILTSLVLLDHKKGYPKTIIDRTGKSPEKRGTSPTKHLQLVFYCRCFPYKNVLQIFLIQLWCERCLIFHPSRLWLQYDWFVK